MQNKRHKEDILMMNDEYLRALTTLGESGVYWVDQVFKICVIFLVDVSQLLGISYEKINVLIL